MSGQDDRRPDDAEEAAAEPFDEGGPAGDETDPKAPSASADHLDGVDDTGEPTGTGSPEIDDDEEPASSEDPASGASDVRPDEAEVSDAGGAEDDEAESGTAGSDLVGDTGEPDTADPLEGEPPEEPSDSAVTEQADREGADDPEGVETAPGEADTDADEADAGDRELEPDESENLDEDRENDGGDLRHVPDEAGPAASAETSSEPAAPPVSDPRPAGAWRRLGAEMRPRFSRSQVLAGLLCAALGFALVVQVQQSSSDQLSSARQDDLVRLLEEVTDRAERLSSEVAELEGTRDELESGTNKAASALELAQDRAAAEGILSGRLPAQGPGVVVRISDPGGSVEAAQLFNVLEELRNAGSEVVAVNDVRLVTSTWFRDRDGSIVVDGQEISAPYEWTVIGDPATLDRALEIPGGALATVRTAGAEATTTRHDSVTIDEVREPAEPEYAKPQEADD